MKWLEDESALRTTLKFNSQLALARFITELAEFSDRMNHHADMEIRGFTLHLSLTTHDLGNKVSAKDQILKMYISGLYEK